MKLCARMEVLEKYEVAKKDAYKGRGEPPERWVVKKDKTYQPRKWTAGIEFHHGSENTVCCRQEEQKMRK